MPLKSPDNVKYEPNIHMPNYHIHLKPSDKAWCLKRDINGREMGTAQLCGHVSLVVNYSSQ